MKEITGQLRVKGRLVRYPVVQITAFETEVSVRVEDGEDETVWLELSMNVERLLDFLGRIAVQHPRSSTALCAMIENLDLAFKM